MIKYIGQHIVDFIARFRSDVYLEDVADPGSDTDKFLVVDANNKVGYRTGAEVLSDIGASSEATDLEFNGSTANGVLTYGGAAQIDVESNLTFNGSTSELRLDGDLFTIFSQGDGGTNEPTLRLHATDNNGSSGVLEFFTTRGDPSSGGGSLDAVDGDDVGRIDFIAQDDGVPSDIQYAQILAEVGDASAAQATGKLTLNVGSNTGPSLHVTFLRPGLILEGGNDQGASPIGDSTVNATLGYGSSSVTSTAGDLTTVGNIELGHASDTTISRSSAGVVQIEGSTIVTAANHATLVTDLHGAGVDGAANQILTDDGDGTVTSESGLKWDGNVLLVSSSTSARPMLSLNSDNTDAEAPELHFFKNSTGADGDDLGRIRFAGMDTDTNEHDFALILGEIVESNTGDEEGKLTLSVASHDGEVQPGLIIASGNAEDEVDVTIGNGSTSVVTVPGFISIGGHAIDDIQVAGDTFADVDDQLMSAAAINDLIGSAGGSVSVSDSTANTNFPVVFHDESNNLHDDTGAFTYNPSTGTANIPIASIPKRKFAEPTGGPGSADGDVVYIGSNSTAGGTPAALTAGKIYYFHGGDDAANGSWTATNSGAASTATGYIGVALGDTPATDGVLVRGTVQLADNIVGTEAMGSILYLDKATAGAATTAAPTATGDIVRVIGYAITTGDTKRIWFNPDNTWVEHV